jgi:hypothetical protein
LGASVNRCRRGTTRANPLVEPVEPLMRRGLDKLDQRDQ